MLLLRSLLFHACFHLNTILHMILCSPVLLLPRPWLWKAVHSWAAVNHWLLRVICGTCFEIRGLERITPGALLVAAKHQSAWETFALVTLFSDPFYVLKRELMWLPVFGWYVAKAEMIPIRRGAGGTALGEITERAKAKIAHGRQLILFPEGTRRAVGAEPAYKYGVVHLYGQLGVRCFPVALNSGVFWPRRTFRIYPGMIRMELLEPIEPGLQEDAFKTRVQDAIETATARLVTQGRAELEATLRQTGGKSG
ncbi:MAG TPA: lysophospholipid acyltransferase family protein [Xanthobacteraceae bacterium]